MAFGQYAQYYDIIYRRKEYLSECVYLERLFRRHIGKRIETVLDLGCGTANHMIPLLKKGYSVTGIDASAPMLKLAEQKLIESRLKAPLYRKTLKSFQLGYQFDAVLCLFSVIDYIAKKKDLLSFLNNTVQHMKKTSIFIFDFWQKSAAVGYYTPVKKNIFRFNGNVLERKSTTKIYPSKNICEVQYTCTLKQNGRVSRRDQEKHTLRYFEIEEMEEYLNSAGLKVIDVHPFLNVSGKIKKNTWDVTMVAQKM